MAKNKPVRTIDQNLPLDQRRNVTKLEYISLIVARVGGMFGTTLTGTLAATFLYELFFADFPEVGAKQIADIRSAE